MSFGWSAGNIAQAIVVVIKLVRALDDTNGAASDYREAVAFLNSLKRTLEPLQILSAFQLRPAYSDEIALKFVALTAKFEPSLGSRTHNGPRYRQMAKKLQWRFVTSKRVDELRMSIESHVGILNNLLQRLTLELVHSAQSGFGPELRRTFAEVIDPRLVTLLQEQLQPLNSQLLKDGQASSQQYSEISSKLDSLALRGSQSEITAGNRDWETHQAAAVETIKEHITSAIESLRNGTPTLELHKNHTLRLQLDKRGNANPLNQPLEMLHAASRNQLLDHGPLEELYYLILVYLGYFLRDLFLALYHKVRPVPTLTPRLLARYHISFHDALGRLPRILDYECFVNFKVFKAFLEESFSNTVGSSWVEKGMYTLTEAKTKKRLTPDTWATMIYPGSHVVMFMLVEQWFFLHTSCPTPHCLGTLETNREMPWIICSVCKTEFINRRVVNQRKTIKQTDTPKAVVKDPENTRTTEAPKTQKRSLYAYSVPQFRPETRYHLPKGGLLSGIEKFKHVERVYFSTSLIDDKFGTKSSLPSRPSPSVKLDKKRKRRTARRFPSKSASRRVPPVSRPTTHQNHAKEAPNMDDEPDSLAKSAAQKFLDHIERGPTSRRNEDIFISLIKGDCLDDGVLDAIITSADTIFFGGSLSGRIQWEWSSQDKYRSNLLASTALRRPMDRDGFQTLIGLSEPIFKDPKYDRRLLLLVFLQNMIKCYIFLQCGFKAKTRERKVRMKAFDIIAPRIHAWIEERYTGSLNLHVGKGDLKAFEKGLN
ncbi:hypothetical protein V8E51_017393 [Hyaloscypha variabilis]